MMRAIAIVALACSTAAADPAADNVDKLRDAGDFSGALVEVDRALATRPDDPALLLLRSDVLRAMNRLVEARASLDRAFASTPATAAWLAVYGQIENALGDHAEAKISLGRALAIEPDNAEARAALAEATRVLDIAKPGGQPPAGSQPARVVDELVLLAGSGQLAHALLEHLDPAILEGFERELGSDRPPTLRDFLAEHLDEQFRRAKDQLGELLGYRIATADESRDTATVTVEVARVVVLSASDVASIRTRLEHSSPQAVFGDYGAVYERLSAADRELFVSAFLGRRDVSVEELRFRLRNVRDRWLITEVNYKEGGFERSLVGQLHQKLAFAAGMARGLDAAMERHRPPKGGDLIDLAVLVATLAILGWLAFRIAVRR